MAKSETRAQFWNLNTAKLRRLAKSRIARTRKATAEIKEAWGLSGEDTSFDTLFDEFESAVQLLEKDLAELVEYYDEKQP